MKPGGTMKVRPVRMFVSYSHENAAWCKRLLPVLKVKANVDTLQPWHDTELKAGDRWDKEIRAELKRMDIFLCLVSVQFLASDYIQEVELPIAKSAGVRRVSANRYNAKKLMPITAPGSGSDGLAVKVERVLELEISRRRNSLRLAAQGRIARS